MTTASSSFDRIVSGLCADHRNRVPTLALPPGCRRAEADDDPPAYRTTLADPAERTGSLYRLSDDMAEAVNVALELGQALLVTGEPGCGKTDLAYGVALQLGRSHVWRYDTQSTSSADDLFYRFDHLVRFHDASVKNIRDASAYVELQALGAAVVQPETQVVLIDEIDKAPRDLPNDLLRRIEEPMHFNVREIPDAPWGHQRVRHLVIVTSNAERELPDPFLRRCVFLHLEFPKDPAVLVDIVARHLGRSDKDELIQVAVRKFSDIRERFRKDHADARVPSTGELIAWTRALHARRVAPKDVDGLPLASALLKHKDERKAVLGR